MIPKVISLSLALAVLPLGALAQQATDNLGTQPQFVPDTHMPWPVDDRACDLAFQARDVDATIRLCKLAVDEYNYLFVTLGNDPDVSVKTFRQLKFDKAYTESVELASAYDYKKDRPDALLYASDAFLICNSIGPSSVDELNVNASQLATAIEQHYPELEK